MELGAGRSKFFSYGLVITKYFFKQAGSQYTKYNESILLCNK